MKNEKTIEKKSARDFIYLTSCMLNAVVPDRSRLEAMDLSKVYRLATRHMLASAIYMSLEQADCLMYMDKELAAEWRMYTDAVLRKNILMNVERKRILNRFESEGIWYALLKGCIIADYYPDFGMREMADNDILFDAAYQEKVHDIMVERGYRVTEYKVSNHDVYVKEPAYVFEMHKDLMSRPAFPELYVYFADIDDRLIRNADKPYERRLSTEDFYIYFVGHAYKHYEFTGGTGLRTLADTYLLNRIEMDRGYLEREFQKLGVTAYEQEMARLAEKVFREPESIYRQDGDTGLTYAERHMLEYILGSGVFGTMNNSVRKKLLRDEGGNNIRLKTRVTYILHRLYPKGEGYVVQYPFFYRHVWAYVFLPVYRLARRGNIKRFIREAMLALKTR